MASFKESEIIAEHQDKKAAEKAVELVKRDVHIKDVELKAQKEADSEITIPSTPPDVMVGYLAHYFDIKDIDEVKKHQLENIYQWASRHSIGIMPEDILDTLDLLGEKLGAYRFGENKFSLFNQYIVLYNTKEHADLEIKSLESRWPKLQAIH